MSRHLRRSLHLALIAASILAAALPSSVTAAGRPTPNRPSGEVSPAVPTAARIALVKVAGGLSSPVFVTSARDGSGRLFIVEKTGAVKILKNGVVLARSFINLSASVSRGSEQGLLGLAFHPSFRTNRKFYVNYTDLRGNTVVREYKASVSNPDIFDPASGRTLLRIAQPYANHNGGMLAFGREGNLYIGTGDGGSAGDPGNRAQSTSSLLGKILRINVNGSTSTTPYLVPSTNPYVGVAGLNEIWQRGLRNPWRFSFDRANGNMWIGDVGQVRYEEVDRAVLTSTGAGRGINWGWRAMEGFHCYQPSSGCSTSGKTRPVLEYSHSIGRCSVTGGYVYRGTAIPALAGGYLYGDYCTGEIFVVNSTAPSPAPVTRLLDTALLLTSFGEDANNEVYVCDLNGAVYRIVAG